MTLEIGNKINKLLAEGTHNGLYFSSWLAAHGYSPQLMLQYQKTGWFTMLNRGIYYRSGEQPTAYAAVASSVRQTDVNLRFAAHSALELQGIMHFVPMGKPRAMVTTSKRHKLNWLQSDIFDRTFTYFQTPQLAQADTEFVPYGELQLPVSPQELAVLECLFLAPKHYSYLDVYMLLEQMSGLRPNVVQSLLENTTSQRVKRLFLYMAEKSQYDWFQSIDVSKIDLGGSVLQLTEQNGSFISKYNMVVPTELKEYE